MIDLGSYLTLTDKNALSLSYALEVGQNVTRDGFSFAGMDTTGPITVNLFSVIGNNSLHCQKLITKTFTVSSTIDNCCIITNNSAYNNTIVWQTSTLSK